MKKSKILTLGPEFSYSYNLSKETYPDDEIICLNSIEEVFERVSKDENLIGIIPVENMINGTVRETFISLRNYKVKITKAYDYGISHCLASQSNNFTKILSHPQALAQSSNFLKQFRDKNIKIEESSSTSKAFELAAENESIAAIGSKLGAKKYKLKIFNENIGNNSNNVTRFIEIRKNKIENIGQKTSMIIEPKEDRAGLLFEILAIFKIKDINLTKIESLPTGEKFGEYIFYIDVEASLTDKELLDAIKFLETFVNVYLFGSYDVDKK